jgi:hypothetical protein
MVLPISACDHSKANEEGEILRIGHRILAVSGNKMGEVLQIILSNAGIFSRLRNFHGFPAYFRHMDSSTPAIDDPSINPHMLLICWLNPIFFGYIQRFKPSWLPSSNL